MKSKKTLKTKLQTSSEYVITYIFLQKKGNNMKNSHNTFTSCVALVVQL